MTTKVQTIVQLNPPSVQSSRQSVNSAPPVKIGSVKSIKSVNSAPLAQAIKLPSVTFNTSKKEATKTTKLQNTHSESEKVVEKVVDIEDVARPKNTPFTMDSLMSTVHLVNQSGYRTIKEDDPIYITGQEENKLETNKEPIPDKGSTGMDNESLNRLKNTFRYGFQAEATGNPTGDEKLLLMGVQMPDPIKNTGIYGDMNGANGKNGWEKNELYVANYLNDGVGKRYNPFT